MTAPQVMADTQNYDIPKIPKEVPKIPDLKDTTVINRLRDLEKQLSYMEQENRLQGEQIKRLERSVDDIKRRR